MDADTFLLNPISELFNTSYSLIYTTDPNMATYKKERSEPAQGDEQTRTLTEIYPSAIINLTKCCFISFCTLTFFWCDLDLRRAQVDFSC